MEKNEKEEKKQKELNREESQDEQIRETGQVVLDGNSRKHKVELLTVIGEIEGHESARPTVRLPSMNMFCPSWH